MSGSTAERLRTVTALIEAEAREVALLRERDDFRAAMLAALSHLEKPTLFEDRVDGARAVLQRALVGTRPSAAISAMQVLASLFLTRATELQAEATRLRQPEGSAQHLAANVWRAAAALADAGYVERVMRGVTV